MNNLVKPKTFFLLFCCCFAIFACNNNVQQHKDGFSKAPQTKEDSLFEDVMDGHNAGMAKIGKIKGYLLQSQKVLDSMAKLPASKSNAAYKQSVIQLHQELANADSAMNSWMEDFVIDSFKNNKPKRIEYLESEQIKVAAVKEKILSSIAKADSILKK